jgi:hypothetical protein
MNALKFASFATIVALAACSGNPTATPVTPQIPTTSTSSSTFPVTPSTSVVSPLYVSANVPSRVTFGGLTFGQTARVSQSVPNCVAVDASGLTGRGSQSIALTAAPTAPANCQGTVTITTPAGSAVVYVALLP